MWFSRLNLNNYEYNVVGRGQINNEVDSKVLVFEILDNGEIVGSLEVRITGTVNGMWRQFMYAGGTEDTRLYDIISFILPDLNIPTTIDSGINPALKIIIRSDSEDQYNEADRTLTLKATNNYADLIKKHVYKNDKSKKKIRDKVLIFINDWIEDGGNLNKVILFRKTFLSQAAFDFAINYLVSKKLITLSDPNKGHAKVEVTSRGTDAVEEIKKGETGPAINGKKKVIFYSWQDTVKPNRSYIQDCLEKAVRNREFEIDSATRDIKGSPDIPETILRKISACDIFLADVSIINNDLELAKKTSNPNVLYELGYAAAVKTYENIILVASRETTDTRELPVDIRNKAIVLSKFDTESKKKFIKMLENELSLHQPGTNPPADLDHPYIFINGSAISKPTGSFNVNVYNEEPESYHLDSVEIDGVLCVVDRNLKPNEITKNVNIPNAPVPPYDNRVSTINLNVSRSGSSYKIKQNIKVTDMATGLFDINGWEEKPALIVRTS